MPNDYNMAQEKYSGRASERTAEVSSTQSAYIFRNGFSPLHNYHTTPFVINMVRYRSVEQFIQAQKALLFKDYSAYEGILQEYSAQRCKEYRIANYDHETWKKARTQITKDGLEAKFTQNAQAREKLAATGSAMIVFASHYDRVNGTGLELEDDKNLSSETWEGWNELGLLIEAVREKIKRQLVDNEV